MIGNPDCPECSRLRAIIVELAAATFDIVNEGGGHDLDLWVESEDLTEEDAEFIRKELKAR